MTTNRRAEEPPTGPQTGVTAQQKRVLEALCQGHTSKEIGLLLGCSHRTVEVVPPQV